LLGKYNNKYRIKKIISIFFYKSRGVSILFNYSSKMYWAI
jgi:hypothetical protein